MNKSTENKVTLLSIGTIALIITVLCIYLNSTHYILGHSYRDVFFYLIESLRFSGVEIGGYKYVNYLPPFIPFLTSLLFRLGLVSESSIFITSGIFYFIGIMGMFYLLRLRFNNYYAFFGAFLYSTLCINLKWVANGTLDIAFVALMLWALYFFIQGMEKNQKYFYLAFPFAVLSFFTKYTGAIIVGVMILYFMSRTNIAFNIKKYIKHLFGGIVAGVLTSIPFFAYYFIYNIPLGFLNQAEEVSSRTSLSTTHNGKLIGNDLFFYIKGLIYDISSTDYAIGIIILILTIIGLIVMIYTFQNTLRQSYRLLKNRNSNIYKWTVPVRLFYLMLIFSVILILFSFFTASLFSFVYSEVILFAGLFIFAYSLTKIIIINDNVVSVWLSTYPYLAINIAMLGLFLSYLVFFSAHLTKADRYFTSMAPGFVFIVTLAYEILLSKIKGFEYKNFNVKYLIPIIMMILMLSVAAGYFNGIHDDSLPISEKHAADWISNKDGVILSDRAPVYTWHLQREVIYSKFPSNATLLNDELLENNATWYIGINGINLTDYDKVENFSNVVIYHKT